MVAPISEEMAALGSAMRRARKSPSSEARFRIRVYNSVAVILINEEFRMYPENQCRELEVNYG